MLHGVFGRKLKRNKDQRRRLFMQLSREMFMHGRVKTTIAKAKAVQPLVEKLVTKAKGATNADIMEIKKSMSDAAAEKQLLEMAKTRFSKRTSGFTRIVKLGKRMGDSSEMVFLEFVDAAPVKEVKAEKADKAPKAAEKSAKVQEAEVVEEEAPKKTTKAKKVTK